MPLSEVRLLLRKLITLNIVAGVLGLTGVALYAHHVAGEAEKSSKEFTRQLCATILTLDNGYKDIEKNQSVTPAQANLFQQMHDLRTEWGCDNHNIKKRK